MPPSSPPMLVIQVPGSEFFLIGCRSGLDISDTSLYVEADWKKKYLPWTLVPKKAYVAVPYSAFMGSGLSMCPL